MTDETARRILVACLVGNAIGLILALWFGSAAGSIFLLGVVLTVFGLVRLQEKRS